MTTLNTFTLAAPCTLILMGSIFVPKTLAATFNGQYTIQVMNSGGSYEKIGKIQEYSTTKTLTEFYNYRNPTINPGDPSQYYQYNGPDLGFVPDQAHLFMVRSTTSGEIGLFSVNGDPDDNNGDFSLLKMDYKLIGEDLDEFTIAVADENLKGQGAEVWQSHSEPNLIHSYYGWTKNNTDGAALSIHDNDGDFNWHLEVKMVDLRNDAGFANDTMYFLSADGKVLSHTDLQDGVNATVFKITPDDENNPIETVPEPSNLSGLFILGFLGGGLIFLQKR